MKKRYIIPKIQVKQTESVMPLAASGVTGNTGNTGSNNIGYGGVDRDGILDPSTKENPFEIQW